jgi:hypothetical protein
LVKHDRSIDERQFMIVEVGEPAEVCKEPSSLHREVIGQRGRHNGSFLDFDVVLGAVDEGVSTRKGVHRGGEPKLSGTKIKIPSVPRIRPNRIDDQADRRVKHRGEGSGCRGEAGLDFAHDILSHLLPDLFLDLRARLGHRRRRCRLDGQLFDQFLLLADFLLHVFQLLLHGLEVALQLLRRHSRCKCRPRRSLRTHG